MNSKYIFGLYPLAEGETPDYYEISFSVWAEESEACLANRTEEELAKILIAIDINCPSGSDLSASSDEVSNLSHANILNLFYKGLYPGRSQLVYLLHLKASGADPIVVPGISGLTWEECFAVILLGRIKFALAAEKILSGGVFNSKSEETFGLGCDGFYDLGEYMGMFALDCMEISSVLAALPASNANIYKLPSRAIYSSQSKKANDKRHGASRGAKNRFFAWFDSARDSFGSDIDAIKDYRANRISEEDRVEIKSDRMLQDALRDRKRAIKDNK